MILFLDKNIERFFIVPQKVYRPLAAKTVLNNIFSGYAVGAAYAALIKRSVRFIKK